MRHPRATTTVLGISISHPSKLIFPESKISKAELAEYYAVAGSYMLPEIKNRPLAFLRCPSGRKQCFVQKHPEGSGYEGIPRIKIRENKSKQQNNYLYFTEAVHFVQAVQQNCIEFHPWGSRVATLETPDRLIFDLDPGEGVTSKAVIKLAHAMRKTLLALKLKSFVRVSGGKGLHVVIPFNLGPTWEEAYQWSRSFAGVISEDHANTTVELSKSKRTGKILIDYLRNYRGATAVGSLVVRAREGAPVALPLDWADLTPQVRFNGFPMRKVKALLLKGWRDPWKEIVKIKQTLPELNL